MAASMKNVTGTLLSTLEDKTFRKIAIPGVLSILEDQQLLGAQTANIQNFVSYVHTALHTAENRLEGIALLGCLVKQCSTAEFTEHCGTWVRLLLSVVSSHDSPNTIIYACEVLSEILRNTTGLSELSRDLSSNHIAAIINWILSAKSECLFGAIQVLSACVRHFSGPCGPYKTKIENFLLKVLQDSQDHTVTETVCQVFALLPRVGGGGSHGVKHTESWTSHCEKVLGSLHDVLTQLYQDIETGVDTYIIPRKTLPLSDVTETEPRHTFQLSSLFQSLCQCLKCQISNDFPAMVNIPVDTIVSFVCRTLAINCKILANKTSTEFILLSSFIPRLHTCALQVLETLMKCCGRHMIGQGGVINKLCIQTLGWTNSNAGVGQQRPYRYLRAMAYSVLTTWLNTVTTASGSQSFSEKLVEILLEDIKPNQDNTKLLSSHNVEFERSKKKRKKHKSFDVTDNLIGQQKVNPLANVEVTLEALRALTSLVQVQGTSFKPVLHRDIHTVIVPLLLTLQQNPDNLPIPYTSTKCRQQLYQCLLACVLVPHPRWPPPLQCSVRIFSRGLQDPDIKVTHVCREAQLIINSIIHPRVPSLGKPLSLADLPDRTCSANGQSNSLVQHQHIITSVAGATEQSVAMEIADGRDHEGTLLTKFGDSAVLFEKNNGKPDLGNKNVKSDIKVMERTSKDNKEDTLVAMESEDEDDNEEDGNDDEDDDDDDDKDDDVGDDEESLGSKVEDLEEKSEDSGKNSGSEMMKQGTKRKSDKAGTKDDDDDEPDKKKVDESETDAMLATFVDASPDSD
ncbi:proline-, glutamic acid- and leucine-rich protein 1-like [Glandiceps talaboti]